jgi:hypothetical protein
MPNYTTNLGLAQPLVNNATDQDLWGGFLNTNFGNLDTYLLTTLNWTPSTATTTITVTIPTSGSVTTGSAKTLYLCNATSGAFSANLPAVATASGLTIAFKKTDSSANAITITGNSSDKIDGSNTFSLSSQYQFVVLACDGTNWDIIAQTAPSVTYSASAPINLSGTTFSYVSSVVTNSLGGDVTMTTGGTYYDGPSVAQGSSGTWFVSGTITIVPGGSGENHSVKLWDGTTVIASAGIRSSSNATPNAVSLSGYITSPAGNLRISATTSSNASSSDKIAASATGNGKDSTITAYRIG